MVIYTDYFSCEEVDYETTSLNVENANFERNDKIAVDFGFYHRDSQSFIRKFTVKTREHDKQTVIF